MTLANKITILRILMIPGFVLATLNYIHAFQIGESHEWQRYLAFGIFGLAAFLDALDGFIARRFQQKTELGTFLDPVADKALLISALLLLSRDHGEAFQQLPLWFSVLVISRDSILLGGTVLIHIIAGRTKSRPNIIGKGATFFQMITLGWILLKIQQPSFNWPMIAAGLCTFASGVSYIIVGVKQLSEEEAGKVASNQ